MNDLGDWIALWRVPGIGPVSFKNLVQHFGSARQALDAPRNQLVQAGLPKPCLPGVLNPDLDGVRRDLQWAQQPNHHILTIEQASYPSRLREIAHPPPLLYVNGNPEYLNQTQLAIVGTRNPTPGGEQNAQAFARDLATYGIVITSGLASGIDGISHAAALDCGGISIAVAANGLDKVYPAHHRELAHRLVNQGAIVSEFPLGTAPKAKHFPRRNRIISGLCLGTLVVEAAHRSGSLITAQFAVEQGREVFAIPGSIHNPMARGCHQLIKQGAKLVETAADMLEELSQLIDITPSLCSASPSTAPSAMLETTQPATLGLDKEYVRLLGHLGYDPTPIDVIIERSGLTVEEVSSMLLILELKGYVACSPGGLYTRLSQETDNERISI